MGIQEPRYLAYLLRLWRIKTNGEEVWRASLESAQTGERRGFESLERMIEFLKEQLRETDDGIFQVSKKRE